MAKYLAIISGFTFCLVIAQPSVPLLEVLEFATLDTEYIYFTNWELIKTYEGVPSLSGQDSLEKRLKLYKSMLDRQAAASAHGLDVASYDLTKLWGWDSVDLRWEAFLVQDSPPVYVLALRKNFDKMSLEKLLKERNYQKIRFKAYDLYSRKLDFKADWVLGELTLFNLAILQNKILVLSSSLESIQKVLSTYKQNQNTSIYQRVLEPLGEVAAAILSPGALCSDLSFANMVEYWLNQGVSEDVIEAMKEQMESSSLHPYLSFALGYRYENNRPLGMVVIDYGDELLAQVDLEKRRLAASEGMSLLANLPYQDIAFELEEARVEDTAVVLEMRPFNDQPRRLFELLYTRDMSFAACP